MKIKRTKAPPLKRISALLLFLLPLFTSFATDYELYLSYFPAGKISIEEKNGKVFVKGKSTGLVSWFYRYRLRLIYDLKNPAGTFMEEEENGKRRFYDFDKLMKKKPWLPVVVELLTQRGEVPEELTVGGLKIVLTKRVGNDWYFAVYGSKNVKEVILKGWKVGEFPKEIVVDGKKEVRLLKK